MHEMIEVKEYASPEYGEWVQISYFPEPHRANADVWVYRILDVSLDTLSDQKKQEVIEELKRAAHASDADT